MNRVLRFLGRWTLRFLLLLVTLIVVLLVIINLRYGGGKPYRDVTTTPLIPITSVEEVFTYPEPLGNLAVALDSKIYFTIHPESRPATNKLMVWDGAGFAPFPNAKAQAMLNTPLGVVLDRQARLWVIDHGMHGFEQAKLLAFDTRTGDLVHEHIFSEEIAQKGSFLQDLQVDSVGQYVYIADVSFLRNNPALVVYDVTQQTAHRVLESHPSVTAQDWLIRNPIKDMEFLGGLMLLKPGVDGIAISRDDQTIFYGAMTHEGLYRVPTSVLQNNGWKKEEIGSAVQRVGGKKPLNDGMSTDNLGNVYLTDVEHNAVLRMSPDGNLATLIKDPRIRWPDALSFGNDGWLYVADSSIPDQMLRSKSHMREAGPYGVYRFKPGPDAPAGQ